MFQEYREFVRITTIIRFNYFKKKLLINLINFFIQ